MSRTSSLIKAPARYLIDLLPSSLLEKIENLVQKQLGKGSGAWSTTHEAKVIYQFVQELNIRNVIAIDAGANVGNWSAEILKFIPEASIFAFEPSAVAFNQLSDRFKSDLRVKISKSALGESTSDAILYSDQGGSGLGSLTKRRLQHFGIEFNFSEHITVERLDSWIEKNKIQERPNVLKMDVEGHELEVLTGAKDLIADLQLIQFEFGGSNIDTKTFFQDFWYFFQENNFILYRVTPRKRILVKNYSEQDEVFRPTNYIAVRK